MPRFAANLGYLFTEHDFLDRFAAARRAGFRAVEFAAPYAYPPEEIAMRLLDNALECILINLPMGDRAKGDFGIYDLDRKLITLIGAVQLNDVNRWRWNA